ncbi:LysR substrate-binding domain-containing protein [Lysinibacillus antri]|uniref:LysR substrate-binding domain-containing protein n=1 Tax=Lysinibacillus antri TaxID=2498145 RepID=A0A3S0P5M9_9BACI|nr:LysR substrate-binding domain-containing protein [Lysinibacillus antri]RUL47426.1 hypothetical protein EK386_18070 [Lysinibacillus antri]
MVTLQDLADYPIVLYMSQFLENFIHSYEKVYGEMNVLFHTSNTEVIKKTVAEGLAIGLVSNYSLIDDPFVETGRIVPLALNNFTFDSDLYYGCIISKKDAQHGMVKKFLEYIKS